MRENTYHPMERGIYFHQAERKKEHKITPEEANRHLNALIREIAKEQNLYLGGIEDKEREDLLDPDGRINMDAYKDDPLYKGKIVQDQNDMKEREEEWSECSLSTVQKFYTSEYPDAVNSADKEILKEQIRGKWKEKRENGISSAWEKLIVAIYYKVLKSEFLIMRASSHDDYNGADTIILNKETGDILCAFDEVTFSEDKSAAKNSKVNEINEKGGMTLDYGLALDERKGEKKMIKGCLRNIPVFSLCISKERLENALRSLKDGIDEKPSDAELEIFMETLGALEKEREAFLKNNKIKNAVKKRIDKLYEPLMRMRGIKCEKCGY